MPKLTVEVSDAELARLKQLNERAAELQKTMAESFGMNIGRRACLEAVLAFSPEFRNER